MSGQEHVMKNSSLGVVAPSCPASSISLSDTKDQECPVASSGCSSLAAGLDNPPLGQPSSGSSARVSSSIRRTGTDGTWTYPSIEMFKAAMLRKGSSKENIHGVEEETLAAIVHMHNIVNEQAWQKILKYERLHRCTSPSLTSFHGKANEFTLKARLWHLFGFSKPFDRHDWYVDRCGERTVKYIIDFYEGQKKHVVINDETLPIPSIYLDVRPAPTLAGIVDRLRMVIWSLFNN